MSSHLGFLTSRRVIGVMAAMLIGAGCGRLKSHDDGGVAGNGGAGGTDAPVANGGAGGGAGGATDSGVDATDASVDARDSGVDATDSGVDATDAGVDATDAGGTDRGTDAGRVTVTCPTTITGALETTDSTQMGRESRIAGVAACGILDPYPGNGADTSNLHFFDVYHFVNPTGAAACFSFTLTYDTSTGLQRYLTAYTSYDPANIGIGYLGDVGDVLSSPQTMGISVPAGATIAVVVFAIDVAPNGVGSYTLKCDTGGSAGADSGVDSGADTGGGNDAASGSPDAASDN